MGTLRRRRRHYIAALLATLILISAATSSQMKTHYTEIRSAAEPATSETGGAPVEMRRLIGSSPPTCRWRCGRCRPCEAVRVTIHPGVSVPLDYYPEAWRCKCRNHLFMP